MTPPQTTVPVSRPSTPPPAPTRPSAPAGAAGRRGGVPPIFAILTVILAITTILFAIMAFSPNAAPIKTSSVKKAADIGVENQITSVASRFTQNLITFNYNSIDADFTRTEKDTTAGFATKSHDALGGTVASFKRAITNAKASSTGEVRGVIVSSRDNDTATTLVVVAQTVRNAKHPEPRARLRLFEETLLKSGSAWKVDTVGNVNQP